VAFALLNANDPLRLPMCLTLSRITSLVRKAEQQTRPQAVGNGQ
jgi:hypothetical protein